MHVFHLLLFSWQGWPMYAQLLIDLFKYLAPFLRNVELTKPMQILYKVKKCWLIDTSSQSYLKVDVCWQQNRISCFLLTYIWELNLNCGGSRLPSHISFLLVMLATWHRMMALQASGQFTHLLRLIFYFTGHSACVAGLVAWFPRISLWLPLWVLWCDPT